MHLGIILRDQKNPECIVYYKRAIELNKKYGNAYFNLALVYLDGIIGDQEQTVIAKDIQKAIGYFEQATENGTYTAHLNLGTLYKDQKEEAKSREHYKKAAIHFRAGYLKDPKADGNRLQPLKDRVPDDIEILYYISTAWNQNLLAEKKLSAEDTRKIRVLFEEDMSSDNEAIRKNAIALMGQLDQFFTEGQDLAAIRLLQREPAELEELKKENAANNGDRVEAKIYELFKSYKAMLEYGVAEAKVREKMAKLLTKEHMELARAKSKRSKLGDITHFEEYKSYFRSVVEKYGSLNPEEAIADAVVYEQTQVAQPAAEVKAAPVDSGLVSLGTVDVMKMLVPDGKPLAEAKRSTQPSLVEAVMKDQHGVVQRLVDMHTQLHLPSNGAEATVTRWLRS